MKLKELKHNHSLTDLLKVLIFSILMITPLLSVATRCLYVISNKNAYQSYDKDSVESVQIVENVNQYKEGLNYIIQYNELNTGNWSSGYGFSVIENLDITSFNNYNPLIDYVYIRTNANGNIYISDSNFQNQANKSGWGTTITHIEVKSNGNLYDISGIKHGLSFSYFYIYTPNNLDNVFEYSVNKLAESPILSWTQQTAIYTGVNTMTTQLGVSTPTIAMLIVYWFLLTVIYIIIDIIIKLFTWLTHMIGSKSV